MEVSKLEDSIEWEAHHHHTVREVIFVENIKAKILLDNKEIALDVETATLYAISDIDIKDMEYELLKVLAVLKRSEVFKKVRSSPYYEKDLRISVKKRKIRKSFKKAVEETKGEVVFSNDKLVELYYTMCCGGVTSNAEDIIGKKLDYIRKVYCDKCKERESYRKIILDKSTLKVDKEPSFNNDVKNIFSDVVRNEEGRIQSVNILGETLSGEEFIKRLNLKSNKVLFKEEVLNLKVLGEGLGLGICIEGAQKLAKEGKKYKEIIEYYYTNIRFDTFDKDNYSDLNGKVIVLDPGHGGEDKGNIIEGFVESEIVLDIAKKLKPLLEKKNIKVHLTREENENRSLTDRIDIANKIKPDFLLSLHLNAFLMPGVNGCEAHCYELDGDAVELSNFILNEIENRVKIKKRKVNFGDYLILRESKSSTIIIECLYLTGNKDIKFLDEDISEKIAKAIYKGICKYYNL